MADTEKTVQLIQATQQAVQARPDISGNFPLDDAIIDALPKGTKVISAESYGCSQWSVTARIFAETADGASTCFFLKCTTGDSGRARVEGEFHAMSELRKTVPTLVPEPIAWGECHHAYPTTYFFLIEFVNVSDRLPDPAKLGAAIAELHRKSVSPNGKFGFHIKTYDGKLPHNTEWNDSWPDFFVKFLTSVYDQDVIANGVWKDLESIFERAMKFVVPRLLGALEADGRKIKPCLIHADLWEGNIGTEYETGRIIIFDSCAFYAHNELELGQWRCSHRNLRAKPYKREYLRHFAASEPVGEWDDRNRLYSLNEQLIYSALFPGTDVRYQAYQNLSYLVKKYAPTSQATLKNTENVDLSIQIEETKSVDVDKSLTLEAEVPPLETISITEGPGQPSMLLNQQDLSGVVGSRLQALGSAHTETTETFSNISEAKEDDLEITPRNSLIEPKRDTIKRSEAGDSAPADLNTENPNPSTQIETIEFSHIDQSPVPEIKVPLLKPTSTIEEPGEPSILLDNHDLGSALHPRSQDWGSASETTETFYDVDEVSEDHPATIAPASQATLVNTENVDISNQVEKVESVDVGKSLISKTEVQPLETTNKTEEPSQPSVLADTGYSYYARESL